MKNLPSTSAFARETGFNIASAFPVTDEIVRKVSRAKWERRLNLLADYAKRPNSIYYIAAGLAGLLAAKRLWNR